MKNLILKLTFFIFVTIGLFSCKLQSSLPVSEFTQQSNLQKINGTYLIPENDNDSLIRNIWLKEYGISDLVKDRKDKELFENNKFQKLSILYDGENSIVFKFSGEDKDLEFKYKCEPKNDYVEIYFKKKRIWALPLFLNYQYDRLRLGLDADSNLILHKWHITIASLTIIPFDTIGNQDYSKTFVRYE